METAISGTSPTQSFKYWAFISYSHRDKKWGDWLHRALETYRVPKRLRGEPTRDGVRPKKLFPIFRDREELPVSADLGTQINEALTQARYLIVVCSPNSARSRWVNEEIKYFKQLGRENRILALIVAGEPNASENKPGPPLDEECFPEGLRYGANPDGQLLPLRTEPIAGDARAGKDGKLNAKLKLLAGLLHLNFDALKQREQERRRRFLSAVAAGAGTIAVLMAALAGYALLQTQEAQRQTAAKQTLLEQASWASFNQAERLLSGPNPDWQQAIALFGRAVQFNPKNQIASERLVNELILNRDRVPKLDSILIHQDEVLSAVFSPDGCRCLTTSGDTAQLWDTASSKLLASFQHDNIVNSAVFSPDGSRCLTASYDHTAKLWDTASGKLLASFQHDGAINSAVFSPDGSRCLTASGDHTAKLWDAASGKLLASFQHGDMFHSAVFSPMALAVSPPALITPPNSGTRLLVNSWPPFNMVTRSLPRSSVPMALAA